MNMPDPQAFAATWMSQFTDPKVWQGWMTMPPALSMPSMPGMTPPAGAKPAGLPLVLLVHGGPWVRGSTWGWDAQ